MEFCKDQCAQRDVAHHPTREGPEQYQQAFNWQCNAIAIEKSLYGFFLQGFAKCAAKQKLTVKLLYARSKNGMKQKEKTYGKRKVKGISHSDLPLNSVQASLGHPGSHHAGASKI